MSTRLEKKIIALSFCLLSNQAFSMILRRAPRALNIAIARCSSLRFNAARMNIAIHRPRALSSKATEENAMVLYTPETSKSFFAGTKNVVTAKAGNYSVKPFDLLLYKKTGSYKEGQVTCIYTGTNYGSKKDPQAKLILTQDVSDIKKTQEAFNQLPLVLQKEIIRDINKKGQFFKQNSWQKTASIESIFSQLPPSLSSHYANIIRHLPSNRDFTALDCITMHSLFQCASIQGAQQITHLETHIVGRPTSNAAMDCCDNCQEDKQKKISLQNQPILLPSTTSPHKILQIAECASQEEIITAYATLRSRYAAAPDKMHIINSAFDQLIKK